MAEIIVEKPSMQKVIYKLENPSDELAFAYYYLVYLFSCICYASKKSD